MHEELGRSAELLWNFHYDCVLCLIFDAINTINLSLILEFVLRYDFLAVRCIRFAGVVMNQLLLSFTSATLLNLP